MPSRHSASGVGQSRAWRSSTRSPASRLVPVTRLGLSVIAAARGCSRSPSSTASDTLSIRTDDCPNAVLRYADSRTAAVTFSASVRCPRARRQLDMPASEVDSPRRWLPASQPTRDHRSTRNRLSGNICGRDNGSTKLPPPHRLPPKRTRTCSGTSNPPQRLPAIGCGDAGAGRRWQAHAGPVTTTLKSPGPVGDSVDELPASMV